MASECLLGVADIDSCILFCCGSCPPGAAGPGAPLFSPAVRDRYISTCFVGTLQLLVIAFGYCIFFSFWLLYV